MLILNGIQNNIKEKALIKSSTYLFTKNKKLTKLITTKLHNYIPFL